MVLQRWVTLCHFLFEFFLNPCFLIGGLPFCVLLDKLVKECSHGFWANMVENCHKCIENEVWKVWLQKELIFVGFGLAKFGGLTFFTLVGKLVNKWSYGFYDILVGNCHKCIKNEVWKVWLQKELILVGFWLSQVRWIGFFCLGTTKKKVYYGGYFGINWSL